MIPRPVRRAVRWSATLGLALALMAVTAVSGPAEAQTGWMLSPDGAGQAVAPPDARPPARPSTAATAPVIVLDPGHSGRTITSRTATGLRDVDYPNDPEIYEVWDISVCVAEALRADGYRVVLTKTHARSSVSLAARAAVADRAHAALAVSVHDDHTQSTGFQAVYSQRGVGPVHPMYRGTGRHRTVFAHPGVARRSDAYAHSIAAARTAALGHRVPLRENQFAGRAPLEPGNLALVQLLSSVPWVYNEAGARTAGSPTRAMSIGAEAVYARGLLVGIETAVPVAGSANSTPSVGGLRGCLVRQIGSPGHLTRPIRYLPAGWS